MGITRKAPRAVVFGRARCGGIGLYHIVAVQIHDQLQYLLGHLRCQDTTGQRIHMIMEFTQMECGCTDNVLEQSYKQYTGSIINKKWITVIWAHLERCEATVKLTGFWKLTHIRVNDSMIMEIPTASGLFKPTVILAINRCRLYLQVFFTSDIAGNRGKNLEPHMLKGQRQNNRRRKWGWSVHQQPTLWKWKHAINDLFA
jgi:hypothetical protein